jgi:hypothetical protein
VRPHAPGSHLALRVGSLPAQGFFLSQSPTASGGGPEGG